MGEFEGVEVAIIIFDHGRFTTYRSIDKESWPPLFGDIVHSPLATCLDKPLT